MTWSQSTWLFFIKVSLVLGVSWMGVGLGCGAWFRTPQEALNLVSDPVFRPEFAIIRLGEMLPSGDVKVQLNRALLPPFCRTKIPARSWLGYRIKKGEVLSEATAGRLGASLNQALTNTCFQSVEIDFEPLNRLPSWFKPFCRKLRQTLDKKYELHVAIPPVTKKLMGGGNAWFQGMALDLLTVVDGIDVMIYDTRAKTVAEYEGWIREGFDLVQTVTARVQNKKILLGFPSYPDMTASHQPKIENLATISSILRKTPRTKHLKAFFCSDSVKFAMYAGWTMDMGDKKYASSIHQWHRNLCYY